MSDSESKPRPLFVPLDNESGEPGFVNFKRDLADKWARLIGAHDGREFTVVAYVPREWCEQRLRALLKRIDDALAAEQPNGAARHLVRRLTDEGTATDNEDTGERNDDDRTS